MTSEEDVPLTREFTIDSDYPTRLSWALVTGLVFRRPAIWLLIGLAVVAAIFSIQRPDLVALPVALILASLLITVGPFFTARRRFSRQFPPGSIMRMGFGETRFATETASASSTVAYSIYSRAIRRGRFVWLRQRVLRVWMVLPGELFGDDDLARFPQN